MTIDNTKFAEAVLALCPAVYSPDRFPMIEHDVAGDCLEVFQSDEPHYGERIDERVTVYIGQESGEIVGALVKGLRTWIARILTEYPGFQLDVNDEDRAVLGILFHLRQLKETDPQLQIRYKSLSKVANGWRVNLANCDIQTLQNSKS